MNQDLIGQVAGGMSFAAYALYIATTVLPSGTIADEQTKPHRATWWILTLIGALVAETLWSSGTDTTIWVALSYFLGPLIIALVSLKKEYGVGGWDNRDKKCLLFALICLFIRIQFRDHESIALLSELGADFFGLIPTIEKSWHGEGEDELAWVLETAACALNMFAINHWTFDIWAQPVYLLVMNGLIAAMLLKSQARCEKLLKTLTNIRNLIDKGVEQIAG